MILLLKQSSLAFYTSGMNKLELKPHPKDSKGIMFYIRHAKKYPEEPSALAALWKKKGYHLKWKGMTNGEPANLTCSKKHDEFPNACSTLLETVVLRDRKKPLVPWYLRKDTVNVGVALYFYSTYSKTEKKIHEIVESVFALGTEGLCHRKYKLTGQCVNGMSDKKDQVPRPVEDPPMPPSLGEKCQPKFPQLKAQRPPWGLVPILLILLLIMFLLGGAVAVYVYLERQRRTQELS